MDPTPAPPSASPGTPPSPATPPRPTVPAPADPAQITLLLDALCQGDKAASEDLLPMVYEELRKLAHSRLSKEKIELTMGATGLVHEAYLRLLGPEKGDDKKWDNRGHFFGAAAIAMRRIIVERARHRARIKHGGGVRRVALDDNIAATEADDNELLALNDAMDRLEKHDKRKFDVVMLRYFGGLTVEEAASALDLSPATVKNDWAFAKAWLHREVTRDSTSKHESP